MWTPVSFRPPAPNTHTLLSYSLLLLSYSLLLSSSYLAKSPWMGLGYSMFRCVSDVCSARGQALHGGSAMSGSELIVSGKVLCGSVCRGDELLIMPQRKLCEWEGKESSFHSSYITHRLRCVALRCVALRCVAFPSPQLRPSRSIIYIYILSLLSLHTPHPTASLARIPCHGIHVT